MSCFLKQRPRRNRQSSAIRALTTETILTAHDLVMPLFVMDEPAGREAIVSMPGIERLSFKAVEEEIQQLKALEICAVALFPKIDPSLKDPYASASLDPNGLVPRMIALIKSVAPDMAVFTDVAMDPYSSDGHDGLVIDGKIDNDQTLDILAKMAVVQAKAGADFVAPSDMMDGRVGTIRQALDQVACTQTGILSYTAKYASAFYGPFRDALDSAPQSGDKKTYQMNPANIREAIREAELDMNEGADMLMVKPGLPYLDVIHVLAEYSTLPIAAYHVSGEYAMIKAAASEGWVDGVAVLDESLLALKRAGADIIFSYGAKEWALNRSAGSCN